MSRFQLFAFILQIQIGIGVLTFPHDLYQITGADGWISILLAGACIQLLLLFYVGLIKRFPRKNLFEFAPLIVGKWIAGAITFFYALHFMLVACLILLLEVALVDLWILPYGIPWLVILANFVLMLFFARQSLRIIIRYHTLISFFILLMLAIMFFGSDQSDYRYLLPVGQAGWPAIMAGVKSATVSFLGFELLLVVSSDIQASGKSIVVPLLWSNLAVTLFYLIIVLICFLYFSPDAIRLTPQPVPYYLNGISLPFLDRLDLIFLSIWLVKVTATLIGYLYGAAKGLGYLFHGNKHAGAVLYLAPAVCAVSFQWRSAERIGYLVKYIELESYFVMALPIMLLFAAVLTGKREVREAS